MESNLFNFDFVNAKTGKVLTKVEKRIQYVLNLIISRVFQLFVLCRVFQLFVLLGFALFVVSIFKMLWYFLIS